MLIHFTIIQIVFFIVHFGFWLTFSATLIIHSFIQSFYLFIYFLFFMKKNLLHSILPEHTAIKLRDDIREVIKQMKIFNEKAKRKREGIISLNAKK